MAAYTYVIGGGYMSSDVETPIRDQEKHAIGIKIGNNVWLGAKTIVSMPSLSRYSVSVLKISFTASSVPALYYDLNVVIVITRC